MTNEKFEHEIKTLKKFFELYCHSKHNNQTSNIRNIQYNNKTYNLSNKLCDECNELILYSYNKLSLCPHNPKPMCRKCPSPCYNKTQWKAVAKLMRYSGMKLGLIKIRTMFKKSKKDNHE